MGNGPLQIMSSGGSEVKMSEMPPTTYMHVLRT